ncbi:MAG: hypothetical protein ABL893_12845, partial [Hyphomicrobium sp.]
MGRAAAAMTRRGLTESVSGMSRRGSMIIMLLAAVLAALFSAVSFAAPVYPELTGRIVDNANLLTADDRAA